MFRAIVVLLSVMNTLAFGPASVRRVSSSRVNMVLAPPGMKPTPDGGFKVAGAFLDEYVLLNENGAKAVIRTYGCNAFTYVTADGIEVMGTRADAKKGNDEKPYPGGAPHCFPQFGPGAILQHGFARGMKFIPEERAKKLSFDRMIFKLEPTEETIKIWDHDFEYRVDITLRADCLEWDVIVVNKGEKPFDITTGLHTYWDVSSLKNIKIEGPFKGAETLDRLTSTEAKADSDTIVIDKPVDMLYKGVTGPIKLIDSGKKTITTIERKGYADTCVWSPFGNDAMGFDKFICIEPVSCAKPVTIPPGKFKETKFYQKVSCKKM